MLKGRTTSDLTPSRGSSGFIYSCLTVTESRGLKVIFVMELLSDALGSQSGQVSKHILSITCVPGTVHGGCKDRETTITALSSPSQNLPFLEQEETPQLPFQLPQVVQESKFFIFTRLNV